MTLRDRLPIGPRWQRRLARAMQLTLVGLFFIGLDRGNTGIVVNAAVGFLITQLPPVLERDYGIPMDAGLVLWITTAVFLHALGTVGLPGSDLSFYRSLWWWDHLTHALSASIVAAVGYATARALDEHSAAVELPPRFMFVLILLITIAFGVLWEVIEFTVGQVALLAGGRPVLTQYGLADTMLDLVFDVVGAVIVAVWGTAHLTNVVRALTERLDDQQASR